MRNVERITSVKSELLDIFMSMEVDEHAQRQRSAAQRSLRARRGIELHREFQNNASGRNIARDDVPYALAGR